MNEENIKFKDLVNFSEKQQQAHLSLKNYKYVLYGGAMGGGKSYWLRWELVFQLLKFAKQGYNNVIVGLFCEDYPALKDRHLSKIGIEFPDWLGDMHSDHKNYGRSFILRSEYGGGVIAFRNLDDASKYQSAEFAIIAIDELTKNEKSVFDDLMTRLRWAGIKDTKFIAGTNPGGIGHGWVKKWWLDRDFEEEVDRDLFAYIQALALDNPHLDKSYLQSLDMLPEDKCRAFRDGDWDIFKGQYFSEFRREIHVIKPQNILPYYKKFICGDYGYSAPSAIFWCYTDQDGVVYIYRELYKTNLTYENLTKEIIANTPANEDISYWVFDPAIWAKKGETELCGAEIMEQTYREITKKNIILQRGINDRLNGWSVMREYLKPFLRNGEKIAKLQIFNYCHNFIRTLPAMVYDENKIEDLDTDGEDHCADAVRYGLMSRPRNTQNSKSDIYFLGNNNQQKVKTIIDLE